jgi:hypothetical protein
MLAISACGLAQTEDGARYWLRPEVAGGGLATMRSNIPVNRTYAELTDDQKRQVRSLYVSMPETDEPPFPLYGLESIYRHFAKIQAKLSATGRFYAEVEIGTDGQAKAIRVFEAPRAFRISDKELQDALAGVVVLTPFKPGMCGGSPCRMSFPISVDFGIKF